MKTRKIVGLFISLIVIFAMVGCSDNSSAGGNKSNVTITTGGTGGTLYPIGASITKIVNGGQDTIKVTNQASGGSVENVTLLQQGDAEFAIMGGDVAVNGYEGADVYEGNPQKLSGVFVAYDQPLTIVTLADSDINSIQDIKGKKVVVGQPGSGNEVKSKRMLEILDITYDDFEPQFISFSEAVDALKDNHVDVGMFWSGSPNASIMDLATTEDIKFISLSDEERERVSSTHAYYVDYTLPAGLYEGMDEDMTTLSVNAQVVTSPEVDEDVVYTFVKTLFENVDDFSVSHDAVKDFSLKTATENTIPLHPGAEKYYKEVGAIE
ncbi:TAXI family TRAP transporter solute-binding subunit [Bacillus taeanensis]|uniref:C4-dicarboxylate ABC transporter substrate-binding protein n=1 Tax=Bacillus taeanensis TaxID=273032 RepID=A0A366XSA6_9BACI|nr:TAXI family TRAP transporter solute-binding subunit [Bacillus taeanensis]RBW68566.1 C4-dicarboxylate ABC transporter substrate-binding protein [Bacillus taeanensis]